MAPLVIAAAGALAGALFTRLMGTRTASAPTFAVQPATWNLRYTKTGVGDSVAITAERVPGFGSPGEYEEWSSNLVWEAPDGSYGVIYGGAPREELKGFIYARPKR